jgi:radical SAM superfamily enzyme YgiQ (UPF0313 family)
MKFKLIYPKWPKLRRQTEFHLPPHGPVVFAASLPDDVDVQFVDENLESIDFDDPVDLVGISMMLTIQVKRGWEIADAYREKGVPVLFGGIAAMLHAEETMRHGNSVFLGESEGRMEKVLSDFKNGNLQKVYDFLNDRPPIEMVGPALRNILKRDLYNYKGIQMVDLIHASRDAASTAIPVPWPIWAGNNSGLDRSTRFWKKWPASITTGSFSWIIRSPRIRYGK